MINKYKLRQIWSVQGDRREHQEAFEVYPGPANSRTLHLEGGGQERSEKQVGLAQKWTNHSRGGAEECASELCAGQQLPDLRGKSSGSGRGIAPALFAEN